MAINKLKTYKTHAAKRTTYRYYDAEGKVTEIVSGVDGVTELDIKELHRLDDREVENNLDNLKPKRTKEEKAKMKEWQKQYIEGFKNRNGYTPHPVDVKAAVNEAFPPNYNMSLSIEGIDDDKSEVAVMAAKDTSFKWSDRMEEAFDFLNDKQRELVDKIFVQGWKQKEIAEAWGVSTVAIHKQLNTVKSILAKNL